MASWDHRAGTGNGAYQFYLFVNEEGISSDGNGVTTIGWELGIIKVGNAGGFNSSDGAVEWDVQMHGYNNGDRTGTSSFFFGSGEPIGKRVILASQSGWTFAHDPAGSGLLTLSTYARATFANSIGSPQIGWGDVGMTSVTRAGQAPAAPILVARNSDTSIVVRGYNSPDWGTGTGGVQHYQDASLFSNFSSISSTGYPTTGGNAAHDVTHTVNAHTTAYFRNALGDRTGNWRHSGTLVFYGRPSKPGPPELTTATTNSLTLNLPAPSYTGDTVTSRKTQLSLSASMTSPLESTASPAVFNSLARAQKYYTRYQLTTSAGTSDWSNIVEVSTIGAPPSAPTGYGITDLASTSATVTTGSLADNGGAVPSRVRVKLSTTASDAGLLSTNEQASWNPVRLNGLTENTSYYVAEAAYNDVPGGGWGPYGAWVPFTTLNTVPNSPTLSVSGIGGTTATLQWTVPSDLNGAVITAYKVRVARDSALTVGVQDFTTAPGSLAQVLSGLPSATQHFATVWTETDKGRGSSSTVLSFATTGGGGVTSGVYIDVAGVPKFAEVWLDVAGVPKLCEVWIDVAGVPKMAVA